MIPLGLTPPSHPCEFDSKGVKARASTPCGLTSHNDPSDLNKNGGLRPMPQTFGLDTAQLFI